jgi:hypothetical protein
LLISNRGQVRPSLFGLAVKPGAEAVYFVDDDDANTLNLLS